MTAAEKAPVTVKKIIQFREGSLRGSLGRPSIRNAGFLSGGLGPAAEGDGDPLGFGAVDVAAAAWRVDVGMSVASMATKTQGRKPDLLAQTA